MKIEKISDNQIKFMLDQEDLSERDIKLAELAYSSEKTQRLFREMMEEASTRFGFHVENSPLMIEAVPVSLESIMIIVSKIPESESFDSKLSAFQRSHRYKFKLQDKEKSSKYSLFKNDIMIYSFNKLDDAADLSSRLYGIYVGVSSLYKNDGKYYLILQNTNTSSFIENDELETVLSEYGQKHISNNIAKYYLVEHGEVIVCSNAISVLAETFV